MSCFNPYQSLAKGLGGIGLRGEGGGLGPVGFQGESNIGGVTGVGGIDGPTGPAQSINVQNTLYVDSTYGLDTDLTNPILRLNFEEGVGGIGDTLADTGTLGNDATINTSTVGFTTGKIDNFAVDLTPADSQITGSDIGLPFGSSPVTMMTWFKLAATPDAGAGRVNVIFAYGRASTNLMMGIGVGSNFIAVYHFGSENVTVTSSLSIGVWYHLAATQNGTVTRLYLDGVFQGGIDHPNTTTTPTVPADRLYFVGSFNVLTAFFRPFNGSIDDVRVYDRALIAGEILDIVNSSDPNKFIGIRGDCSRPFRSIQKAIDESISGDRIVVQHGTYVENLNITKSLTFDFKGSVINSGAGDCLDVSGSGVEVVVKGYPDLITGDGSSPINVSGGAVVRGKFRDLDNFREPSILASSGTVIGQFRDLIVAGASDNMRPGNLQTTGTGIIHAKFRDAVKTSGAGDGGGVINNSNVMTVVCRDLFESSSSSNSRGEGIRNTGNLVVLGRDVTTSSTNPSFPFTGGQVDMICRDIIGNSIDLAYFDLRSGVNLKINARDITRNGSQQSSRNVFDINSADLDVLCRLIRNSPIGLRSILVTGGTNSVKIRAKEIQDDLDFTNGTNDVCIDSDIRFDRDDIWGVNSSGKVRYREMGSSSFPSDITVSSSVTSIHYDVGKLTGLISVNGAVGLNFCLKGHRIIHNLPSISDENLVTAESGVITITGDGDGYFNVDHIENTNGGFAVYVADDGVNTNINFNNSIIKSNTLAVGIEQGVTGPTGASALDDSSRLFFHGSSLIVGDDTVGSFATDSTSIVTVVPAGSTNRGVVVNEGVVTSNFDFESSVAKGVEVVEPIVGPAGAKVVDGSYFDLLNI